MTGAGDVPPDGLTLTDVVLLGVPGERSSSGMRLFIDHRGVVLVSPGSDEDRALRWDRITGWLVDPWVPPGGGRGVVITYQTSRSTYRFGVPGADLDALAYLVEQLSQGYRAGRSGGDPSPAEPEPVPAAERPGSRLGRLQPVLVLVLVLVLATAVTLVLLQSAGVIDLPWLGGSSGQLSLSAHAASRPI